MGKVAFLFPGQGAQSVGMGQALYDCGGAIQEIFQQADHLLGFSLSEKMFQGPEAFLTATENTQPALVVTAMAAHRLVMERTSLRPDYVAGHSLGEYAAICAAGGFSPNEAVRLVRLRGMAMQAAVPAGVGAMAAMLNLDAEVVEELCQLATTEQEVCQPANFNTPGQIVISGHKAAVERAVALAKERGSKRCLMLAVSGPFHSPLMRPAAEQMAQALHETPIADLAVPLIANVTAEPVREGALIRTLLVEQITAPVRWEASIRRLLALGVDTFVELGSGKVLTGMMKRIDNSVRALAVNGPDDLAALNS